MDLLNKLKSLGKTKDKKRERSKSPPRHRSNHAANSTQRPHPDTERHNLRKPREQHSIKRFSPVRTGVFDDTAGPSKKKEQVHSRAPRDGYESEPEWRNKARSTESPKRVSFDSWNYFREFAPGSAPSGGRIVKGPDLDENGKPIKEPGHSRDRDNTSTRNKSRSRRREDEGRAKGKQRDDGSYEQSSQDERDGPSAVPSGDPLARFGRPDPPAAPRFRPSPEQWNGPLRSRSTAPRFPPREGESSVQGEAPREQPDTAQRHRHRDGGQDRTRSHHDERTRDRNHNPTQDNYDADISHESDSDRNRHHTRHRDRNRFHGERNNNSSTRRD